MMPHGPSTGCYILDVHCLNGLEEIWGFSPSGHHALIGKGVRIREAVARMFWTKNKTGTHGTAKISYNTGTPNYFVKRIYFLVNLFLSCLTEFSSLILLLEWSLNFASPHKVAAS